MSPHQNLLPVETCVTRWAEGNDGLDEFKGVEATDTQVLWVPGDKQGLGVTNTAVAPKGLDLSRLNLALSHCKPQSLIHHKAKSAEEAWSR